MTDRERLAISARLLLGERWQCALARRLRVDERLVRRWVAGSRPIPPWVWPRLADEIEAHFEALRLAVEALRSWPPPAVPVAERAPLRPHAEP